MGLAPGIQVHASSDGLRTNLGPRARIVYVGRKHANHASSTAPLTFYTPSQAEPQQPSYLAPEWSPAADKAQQAQALAVAIDSILKLHQWDFPQAQKTVLSYPSPPDHAAILRRRTNDALARVSIFRRSTRKAAKTAAILATRMECDELLAAGQAQHAAIQAEIDQLWQRLITNDSDVLLGVLSHTFHTSTAAVAPLGVANSEAQLAVLVPNPSAVPERHPTTTAAGNLSLKKFTKGEAADLYKHLVAGIMLGTVKQAFAVAPSIDAVGIIAVRSTAADAYGSASQEAIAAAQFKRAALAGVRWTGADSVTILNDSSHELVIRTAGPNKALVPLDLKREPEIASLLDTVNGTD